jgi:hypothetical protein
MSAMDPITFAWEYTARHGFEAWQELQASEPDWRQAIAADPEADYCHQRCCEGDDQQPWDAYVDGDGS